MLNSERATDPGVKADGIAMPRSETPWKAGNTVVFRSKTPNPGTTLIRVKKVSAEWCIRHKLTQIIQPSNPDFSAVNRK